MPSLTRSTLVKNDKNGQIFDPRNALGELGRFWIWI
jgi:hypothetical protein